MLKRAKWVNANQADKPVTDIAAQVLRERLEYVWHFLVQAARRWQDDDEYIHQLRVSSRRATAALGTFAELLPPKRAKKLTKWLKRVRRAAGDARDLDVMAQHFRSEAKRRQTSELDEALRCVAQRRTGAQQAVREIYEELVEARFPKRIDALCLRVRWRKGGEEPSYGELAPRLLRPKIDDFFQAAEQDLSQTENLHALRIQGKRLRYTMELLAGAFDAPFRNELYPMIQELQDRLGAINDHAAARDQLLAWANEAENVETRRVLTELAQDDDAAIAPQIGEFFRWWTPQKSDDLRQKLLAG